jgi:ribosomal protein S15P/S13E
MLIWNNHKNISPIAEVVEHIYSQLDQSDNFNDRRFEQLECKILALIAVLEEKNILTYDEYDKNVGVLANLVGKAEEMGLK